MQVSLTLNCDTCNPGAAGRKDRRGPRFENLVASQLLEYCHFLEDTDGQAMDLRFLRDTERRDVDFVVLRNRKSVFAVECKSGERVLNPAIGYFGMP